MWWIKYKSNIPRAVHRPGKTSDWNLGKRATEHNCFWYWFVYVDNTFIIAFNWSTAGLGSLPFVLWLSLVNSLRKIA